MRGIVLLPEIQLLIFVRCDAVCTLHASWIQSTRLYVAQQHHYDEEEEDEGDSGSFAHTKQTQQSIEQQVSARECT
jgi:hypothetical protein